MIDQQIRVDGAGGALIGGVAAPGSLPAVDV
jgi:hypothetical protein